MSSSFPAGAERILADIETVAGFGIWEWEEFLAAVETLLPASATGR